MIAINDAFLLETSIYMLIKKYFKNTPFYADLYELFHEVLSSLQLRISHVNIYILGHHANGTRTDA
jgi:hypothetical protein